MTLQGPQNVTLVEMDEKSFRGYTDHLVRDYAADKVKAGVWSAEEAEDRAAREVEGLLPEGTLTPDHYLYSARDESVLAEVGILWISPRSSRTGCTRWIYDVIVDEGFRSR